MVQIARLSGESASTRDAQAIIDEKITYYEAAIRELRTRRNIHSRISKLPTELLSEIFVLAKLASYINTRQGSWLNVACVCRHWRDIAVNEARLWNTFDLTRTMELDWVKIMLTRSKDASLCIRIPPSGYEPDTVKVVMSQISRTQDLQIYADNPRLWEVLEIVIAHATPNAPTRLRSLELRSTSSRLALDLVRRVFAAVQMPLMLDLQLYGIALSTIPPMPLLRRFYYHQTVFGFESMAMLLSSLKNTPCLEDLDIGCMFNTSDEEMIQYGPVQLPKLKTISLTTNRFEYFSLLQCIRYPPSSLVRFESRRAPVQIADINNFSGIVAHFASSDVAVDISSISLLSEAGPELCLRLTAWINNDPAFSIRCPVSERDALPLFNLCEMLPASKVRAFRINNFSSIKRDDWARVFRRFGQVQELTVRFGEVALPALLKPPNKDQPPFLQLKQLTLINCDFDSHEALPDFTLSVERLLQERVDLHIPIEVLIILECKIAGATIKRLEEYECVSWDGQTLLDDTDDSDSSDGYPMMF
ncbi:hypothetical protein BDN71DRAFT_1592196 [Pleurotus eryngii]|uniref:F-box domain-containing protein n=1 Tax=Pleurotus eryngii TaxID=5323 RepID=A0A9P6DD92_PLEER|nr:hypothetical protein BDN71DRAFT_1592196 [Pleurotus eryngii]